MNYETLLEKYPEIFPKEEHTIGAREPFEVFGFECNEGWYNIIANACAVMYSDVKTYRSDISYLKRKKDTLENGTDHEREIHCSRWDNLTKSFRQWTLEELDAEILKAQEKLEEAISNLPKTVQIKEKFGTLRWYADNMQTFARVIDYAELMSEVTCEECGNLGKTYHTGWHKTLCHQHAVNKYGEEVVAKYNLK